MSVRRLVCDDAAQSEALGTLLLVALTILVAGTLGVVVLDVGQQVESTPQSSFDTDFGESTVTITYRGGSTVPEADTLETKASSGRLTGDDWEAIDGPVTSGTSVTLTLTAADGSARAWNGETLRIVWTSADGDTSTTLVRTQAPR
ncbi:type IV pilin [Haloplanus sp. C73]|uniref:type IV pilin n=1 Tax=Haloplanus sp. C73 TaxID=3421641 RepID=UPI003EC132DB